MIWSPTVKLGLSEVIGSWKIIASRLPRRSRRVSSGTSSRSKPSKRIEPETSAECFGSSPMMASEVTLLPQPDSPTRPSVAPLATLRSTLSTAWVVRPSSPWKVTRRSLDLDQRRCRSLSGLAMPACDAGVDGGAVGDAGRILARRQERAEMHPALAADRFEALEFGERIGMVVDAQVESRPFLVAMDQQRGRLLAALVAAGRFARAASPRSGARERQVVIGS